MQETDGGLTRAQRRARRTELALLGAAESEFGARGFHDVTIADITERADVALGSFYNYFANKDEITEAVLDEAFRSQIQLYLDIIGEVPDAPPVRRFAAAPASLVLRADVDPAWASLAHQAALIQRWPHPSWYDRAILGLREGREVGSMRFEDPDWTSSAMIAVSRTALEPRIRQRGWTLPERLAHVLDTTLAIAGVDRSLIDTEVEWASSLTVDADTIDRIRGRGT